MSLLTDPAIAHTIYSYLSIEELLSLRLVSKGLQTSLDEEYNRRYFEDFPFDAAIMSREGLIRYARRCYARLEPIFFDTRLSHQCLTNDVVNGFDKGPIVDFTYFRIPLEAEFMGEIMESHSCHYFCLAVQTLDGTISIRRERDLDASSKLDAVVDISGISQLRVSYDSRDSAFLRGSRNGHPVEYNFRRFGTHASEQYKEPLELTEVSQSQYQLAKAATVEKLTNSDRLRRLQCSTPRLAYEDNARHYKFLENEESAEYDRECNKILEEVIRKVANAAPGPLQVLFCNPAEQMAAGSVGDTVYLCRKEPESEWANEVTKIEPLMIPFTSEVEKISIVSPFSFYGLLIVLCKDSKLHIVKINAATNPPTVERLYSHPDVVDVVGKTILFEYGDVLAFDKEVDEWEFVASDAVMISEHVYL